jgi:hypothetical protein
MENSVSPPVVNALKVITSAVERNDFGAANQAHKDMIGAHWDETKVWANSLKPLITFKQRFA